MYLLLLVMLPIVTSAIVYLVGRWLGPRVGWVAVAVFVCTTVLSFFTAAQTSAVPLIESYRWLPGMGVTLDLRVDGLSVPLVSTVNVIALAVTVYSIPYTATHIASGHGLYYALKLLYVAGMVGTLLASNLLVFFLFFEFMLVPSYLIILLWGYGERVRIAFAYFLWTHVGALALLVGIIATVAMTGSLSIHEIPYLLTQLPSASPVAMVISLLMLVGFFVKMAAFGLHVWLPNAHAEAPTPLSALLSPVMIGIGGYATLRLPMTFFPQTFQMLSAPLSIWALLTIVYGGIMALIQHDLKRLLAYSSMSQMGYILLGLVSHNVLGVSGAMFHYVSHATCKALLFMTAGAIIHQADGLRNLDQLGGLAANMPLTAAAAVLGFFGIMGIPPLNGFQSEWMVFSGVVDAAFRDGSVLRLVTAVVGILATVLTAGYGLRAVSRIFFRSRPAHLDHVRDPPLTMVGPMLLLVVATILLGLHPSLLSDPLIRALAVLLGD